MSLLRETGFDASLALAGAGLLHSKFAKRWSAPAIPLLINRTTGFARKAEESCGKAQMALLNELARVCSVLYSSMSILYRVSHWVAELQALPCPSCPGSFLSYAISRGLTLYVKAQPEAQPEMLDSSTDKSLLVQTITGCGNDVTERLPIIAILLRYGMNPNNDSSHTSACAEFSHFLPTPVAIGLTIPSLAHGWRCASCMSCMTLM